MRASELITLVVNVVQNKWDPGELAHDLVERAERYVDTRGSGGCRHSQPSPAILRAIHDMIINANLQAVAHALVMERGRMDNGDSTRTSD
jgi:hypothetical protein